MPIQKFAFQFQLLCTKIKKGIITLVNQRYANGDVYEGYFQDNLPHGHGTLKRGHFLTSAAHVYVGQWDSGQKHGYGVMDDILAGNQSRIAATLL